MKRLELTRVRTCQRCGRGRAELESEDGVRLTVPLDPLRVRELAQTSGPEELRTLADLVLGELATHGAKVREVVIDALDGQLRAFLSFVRGDEPEVVACTAQEGVGLAVRGHLPLYATEEALATTRAPAASRAGGSGSSTLH